MRKFIFGTFGLIILDFLYVYSGIKDGKLISDPLFTTILLIIIGVIGFVWGLFAEDIFPKKKRHKKDST